MEKIAKKLEKYFIISKVKSPISTETTRLIVQLYNSNKEYNISFIHDNGNYKVDVSYGRIGKPLTNSVKIETTNLIEVQDCYLKIVKEKLARGYNFS